MSLEQIQAFQAERERLNELVMKHAGLEMKRLYSLDNQAYREGALPKKIKELMGLTASLALRCDDCITYHVIECFNAGVTEEEFQETIAIAVLVGGTITIPHMRRAVRAWDTLAGG